MKDSIPISQSPGFSEKHKQYISLSLSLSLFSLSLFFQFTHQEYLGTAVKKEKYLFLYMVSVETNQEAKNLTLCYSKLTNIPKLWYEKYPGLHFIQAVSLEKSGMNLGFFPLG